MLPLSKSSDDAIISKDLNGVITTWNGGAERIFGYTAEQVIGKPVTILIPPDRRTRSLKSSNVFGAASASSITKQCVCASMEAGSMCR